LGIKKTTLREKESRCLFSPPKNIHRAEDLLNFFAKYHVLLHKTVSELRFRQNIRRFPKQVVVSIQRNKNRGFSPPKNIHRAEDLLNCSFCEIPCLTSHRGFRTQISTKDSTISKAGSSFDSCRKMCIIVADTHRNLQCRNIYIAMRVPTSDTTNQLEMVTQGLVTQYFKK
jgi:hypothetical protein